MILKTKFAVLLFLLLFTFVSPMCVAYAVNETNLLKLRVRLWVFITIQHFEHLALEKLLISSDANPHPCARR